jgi:Rod binding domain-containing protein
MIRMSPTASAAPEAAVRQDRLLEATRQLEGVFMQYLTQALRSTVPNGGHADAPGADIYDSLLDEHLSQVLANHTKTGIAEALYRQLDAGAADAPDQGKER